LVKYTYGDDLISQKRGSLKSYYHYDGQLSTRQLTDASGNVTDTYTYDAFGLLINRSGATENNYMYTGEQYDPNVGFYYLRARYYNQANGRFLTQDTWPGNVFEPMSLHKYLYCEGNPVNRWDPSGKVSGYSPTAVQAVVILTCMTLFAAAIVNVSAEFLWSWIKGVKIPTKWEGAISFGTAAAPFIAPLWGFGIGIGHFKGRHPEIEPRYGVGKYLILMGGLSLGSPLNVPISLNFTLKSPGFEGANPKVLVGPVSFVSGSFKIGEWGPSATLIIMGMGIGDLGSTDTFGADIGIDYMGGLSILY